MFTVAVTDHNQSNVAWPAGMVVTPERWGWRAVGGADAAQVSVRGPMGGLLQLLGWLRYGVTIYSGRGLPVWWGYINEVAVSVGMYEIGLTLDPLYNRVSVAYTYKDENNTDQRADTDWIQDELSVARYGVKELRYSRSDLEQAEAEDLAQTLLERFKVPARFVREGSGQRETGMLQCSGWWSTLAWKYYERLDGKEAYEVAGNADQVMGVGVTSNLLIFQKTDHRIYNVGGEHGFKQGDKVKITGTSNNNKTVTVASAVGKKSTSYAATTISFALADDINDTASGFDNFKLGDVIQVAGSAANSGIYTIKSIEDSGTPGSTNYDHIEVSPNLIAAEAAGPTITLRRNGYFTIEEAVAQEGPGVNATLTAYGQVVAQSFSLEHDAGSWTCKEIVLRLRTRGSPGDNIRVSIRNDNGSGQPTAVDLDAVEVDAQDLPVEYEWHTFTLPTGVTLNYGTTYWLVVKRTGSNAPDDYYELSVSETATYTRGELLLWDGAAWQSRPIEADLLFQLWGREDNGSQIKKLLETAGQFLEDVILEDSAGVDSRQWRDGEDLAIDEVERLLEQGTSNNKRYLVDITMGRVAVIREQDAMDNLAYTLHSDGSVRDAFGRELEPGQSIAGRWLRVAETGLPDVLADAFDCFVESAEFDARTGRLTIRPENYPDPHEVAALQNR